MHSGVRVNSQIIAEITAAEEYMRYAAGGFARAEHALRRSDGKFLPRGE